MCSCIMMGYRVSVCDLFLPAQVINERNILGTQLVRRNDELALLHEKIRIHQSTLDKGETQYTQRLEDIRILKLEIKKMRREKTMLSRSVSNVEDLRCVPVHFIGHTKLEDSIF